METTIDTPARTKAAGALAGGLLLLLTTLPVHAHPVSAAIRECAQEGMDGLKEQACDAAGASLAPRPTATAKHQHPRARAHRECRGLKDAIVVSEQAERRNSGAGMIESLRQDLLALRKRHRQLGC
ncbi:hypothetical protein [Massilia sp. ST3]|uniref:hypothetical protein n=1 Tax=Massilia sp. ST3 TaxID=2824903 RepID=UPI001B833CD0|nr:hypothetical protein [Massilia sp. ST3]MBQ5946467.1 hypothetical protein [Massilia sp. ST3]